MNEAGPPAPGADRGRAGAAAARPQDGAAQAPDPQPHHPVRARPRPDRDPSGDGGLDRMGGERHRRRGRARRPRRANRARAQGNLALRRRTRFARRLCRLRRRAGAGALRRQPARGQEFRLGRGAPVRDGLRAAPRPIQRHDRRGSARMAQDLFRRHAGAGGRDRRPPADLPSPRLRSRAADRRAPPWSKASMCWRWRC